MGGLNWRPGRPTLIIVDYVAGRSVAVSDIALRLARASALLPQRVRLLLIERDCTGSWWPQFLREGSYSESVDLGTSQFALPINLAAIDDEALGV
jgi:hypothetical protein